MEPKGPLMHSQVPATCPYPEPEICELLTAAAAAAAVAAATTTLYTSTVNCWGKLLSSLV